jgi:uncharacterized membrane protein HdeD (DUF308 family)
MSERRPSYGKKRDVRKQPPVHDLGFTWGPLNWGLLLAGVAAIGFGFFTLARGSMTLAPVCLVVGFCVLVPASLLARAKTQPSGE